MVKHYSIYDGEIICRIEDKELVLAFQKEIKDKKEVK